MKENVTRALARYQRSFNGFTAGQKVVAVIGTAALVLAGVLVFRWAATPSYSPLFTNLSAKDASAVIEQLDAEGVPYEITGNGGTIMVPRSQVYETRISLSGEGLPSSSGQGGYALLDDQDISTSQFKEQTDFKRAMEGELASTIEAIDGVDTAVVHLALPPQQVFVEEQDPATASVLVATRPGSDLDPQQVQAVVHLVASSIDGLDPDRVTVADAAGRVLSATDGADGVASTRAQAVDEFQQDMSGRIQTMLDRVVGPGNSTVQVTANLDFDKVVSETTTYTADEDNPPLSSSSEKETYSGAGAGGRNGAGGVVGPDGGTEVGAGGASGSYEKESVTRDNAVNRTVEQRENSPGSVESLHTAVVIDSNAPIKIDPLEVEDIVADAIGIDPQRGDTVQVSALPFDRTAEEAAAAALEKAEAADKTARQLEMLRNGGLIGLVLVLLLIVWLKGRKRNKARAQATTYVVEQLKQEQAERAAIAAAAQQQRLDVSPATIALNRAERDAADDMRDELSALVERQPEEVAALLRGWLVERP
ncbi:flagellar basal-body MS-ring/collar protein FliF [Nocardioides sp. GCM10027113]|uniref:flagellar basal-body MS-ring/collar protein FliF n=1 Tax=unclassified Nocardioides TaxID=2615069 RepID=UPI00361C0A6D